MTSVWLGAPLTCKTFKRYHPDIFNVFCNVKSPFDFLISNFGCVLKSKVVKGMFQNRKSGFFSPNWMKIVWTQTIFTKIICNKMLKAESCGSRGYTCKLRTPLPPSWRSNSNSKNNLAKLLKTCQGTPAPANIDNVCQIFIPYGLT